MDKWLKGCLGMDMEEAGDGWEDEVELWRQTHMGLAGWWGCIYYWANPTLCLALFAFVDGSIRVTFFPHSRGTSPLNL